MLLKNYLWKTGLLAVLIVIIQISCNTNAVPESGWEKVPEILKSIVTPAFQDKEFLITDYGAVGDGHTYSTEAFRKAIDACNKAGGGKVIVPRGVFFTGAIHLKSNVNLYVSGDATILFSDNPKDYLPVVLTRFEGVECLNYSPFIYAYGQENIAITGSGIIDGFASADNWWAWKGRSEYGWQDNEPSGEKDVKILYKMGDEGVPVKERVFGEGHHLRTNFIQLYKCKNILIDSLTIKRSPMWVIHPVLSENITIQHVKVESHGPNNDGCNPESSKNVLIQKCYFDTGDDCIAIKSGRNADGRRINVASENIVVRDCVMRDGHGGVVIGSETSGNVRNVFIENCTMDSANLERVLRIKTNSLRGGIVEDIYMRNCTIGEVSDAVIKVNFQYGDGDAGNYTPVVRNIYVNNITSQKSTYAIFLDGYERSPIENLYISNSRFNGVEKKNYLSNYKNLSLSQVYINGKLQ